MSTTIHNIIVGKLWLENAGKMTITNHTTGDACYLSYTSYSIFSGSPVRRLEDSLPCLHYCDSCLHL